MRHWFLLAVVIALGACSGSPASKRATPEPARRPAGHLVAATYKAGDVTVNLPREAGAWTRPDVPRRVTAETIFDYMDGGGELYLAYRFDHLDVFEYKPSSESLGTVLVEVYSMKGSDDAGGLLSTDWGGEPASWAGTTPMIAPQSMPPHRALYGAGLLRMWVGPLYVRILAARETPETRQVVLAIGQAISTSAPATAAPAVERTLPLVLPGTRTLRPDRTVFFRSHLVLNSAYYLASQDILGLGLDVDAVTTEYRPAASGERPTRVIAVRYPSAERARAGLEAFVKGYLPDVARTKGGAAASGAAKLEHGWAAWGRQGATLAIVLDAPAEAVATGALDKAHQRSQGGAGGSASAPAPGDHFPAGPGSWPSRWHLQPVPSVLG